MDAEQDNKVFAVIDVVEAVRNLRPKSYDVATDPEADIKARWNAFDDLYEAVRHGLLDRGMSHDDILTTVPDPSTLSPVQLDATRRKIVAMIFLECRFGPINESLNDVLIQTDALVPNPPDPDTGRPGISIKDQALLNLLTNRMRNERPDDWATFYKNDTTPAEERKAAFARMYQIIGPAWMEQSLFPQSLSEHQRQWWVIFALMCHVSRDQWSDDDLKRLEDELIVECSE